MLRNLPAVKLATGSRNPYPIEELMASSSLALYQLFTFLPLLSCSVKNLQNAQMPHNIPTVKLATGSRNPYPIQELTASPAMVFN
jgi:hypothetical protein